MTVLYNSATGTNANFTLSQTAADFVRLRIFFRDNDNNYNSLDVYSPNDKTVSCATCMNYNNNAIVKDGRWTASFDSRNNLTITVNSTVESIVRDNIRGNPGQGIQRFMRVRRRAGGAAYWSTTDANIAVAKTIATNIVLPAYTFTLQPGGGYQSQETVYFENCVPGYEDVPLPNPNVDETSMGVRFQNTLPADYRPGAVLDTDNGVWLSHNRTGGKCHILTADNGTWVELRTQGGDTGEKGNPPSILRVDNGEWFNQRLIGKE